MNALLPLSDQAALAYFEDEGSALAFAAAVRARNDPDVIDVVPAYTSVAVFFDLERTTFGSIADRLRRIESHSQVTRASVLGKLHRIPCCYEMGPDLERVAAHAGLSVPDVIGIHAGEEYTVHAIGFCPGFPYLGYLPESLAGTPRLPAPRLAVPPGTVGLAGRQTGIYTEERPGGWNLIGRTPLELVNVTDGYFPLRTGDRVQFVRIDETAFHRRRGERLPTTARSEAW